MHVIMRETYDPAEVVPQRVSLRKYAAKLGTKALARRWIRQANPNREFWTAYLQLNEDGSLREDTRPGMYMRLADDGESVLGVEVFEDIDPGWVYNGTKLNMRPVVKFYYVSDVETYEYDPLGDQ